MISVDGKLESIAATKHMTAGCIAGDNSGYFSPPQAVVFRSGLLLLGIPQCNIP
jgi:hypothetical protein